MKYIGIEELETQAFEGVSFEIDKDDLDKNNFSQMYKQTMESLVEIPDYSIGLYDLDGGYFLIGVPTVNNEHLDEVVIDNAKYHKFQVDMFKNEGLKDVLEYIKENNISCDSSFCIEVMSKMKPNQEQYLIDIYVAML